jgi:hypothetical protein
MPAPSIIVLSAIRLFLSVETLIGIFTGNILAAFVAGRRWR